MKKSRQQIEAEMREEMEFHRDTRIAALIRRGMSPAEAARTARIEFGNPESHREECRNVLGFRPWDELRADIRYAARTFRNAPGFAFASVAILALAIGVNAAFFTLYANYVLKPLPIPGVERHFDIDSEDARAQGTGPWTPAELESLRQAGKNEIEGLYTTSTITALLLAPIQRHIMVTHVSGNYFQLLGGSPARGRTLTEAEKIQPVAVLSHSGSRKIFPAEEEPLGKTVRIQDRTFTIIGVMPPAFTGTQPVVPDL